MCFGELKYVCVFKNEVYISYYIITEFDLFKKIVINTEMIRGKGPT